MKYRIIIILILVAILLGACQGAKQTGQPLDKVVISTSKKISYGPVFIADAEGYFDEFGIQIIPTEFESSSQVVALIVSGDVDVYNGVISSGLLNILNLEPNVKVVADRGNISAEDSCTYQAIVVRKDLFESGAITTAAGLKDQAILGNSSAHDGFVISSYLAQAGLTVDDAELINMPKNASLDAFANKTISAAHLAEPDLTFALIAGDSVILARDQDIVGTMQVGVVVFGKNLLMENPDLGARFLAAYLKGIKQFNEGKTERNMEILAENLGMDLSELADTCWPSFRLDGSIDFKGVEPFQDWSIANGFLDKAITQDQFYDPSFLEAAQVLLNR